MQLDSVPRFQARIAISVPGKKRRDVELEFELGPSFDRFLTAKLEFSY